MREPPAKENLEFRFPVAHNDCIMPSARYQYPSGLFCFREHFFVRKQNSGWPFHRFTVFNLLTTLPFDCSSAAARSIPYEN
jgi:hypothetical protein